VQFYPLLPYQPALFLEILSNLRNELADSTKSIFSGTARAILAIVAGLRDRWMRDESKDELSLISLVDFYDLIRYELEDIIPNEIEVLEEIEADEDIRLTSISRSQKRSYSSRTCPTQSHRTTPTSRLR